MTKITTNPEAYRHGYAYGMQGKAPDTTGVSTRALSAYLRGHKAGTDRLNRPHHKPTATANIGHVSQQGD